MIEIKEIVVNLLDSVEEIALVAKTYPNDWTQFPTAIYKTSDKPYTRDTSGPENMTEHTIYIELYGKASLTSIENTLNNKFREIGFTRIIRSDGEDPATGLIRTSIQYKGIVDNRNGLVYHA